MSNKYISFIEDNFIEIDLHRLVQNFLYLKSLTKSEIAPVVKANSYNLGASKVSTALYNNGCKRFFVAHLNEAITLREELKNLDIEIYVLHGIRENQCSYFHKYNFIPVINSIEEFDIFIKYFTNSHILPKVVLHFDTGINRLGIRYKDIPAIINHPEFKKINILYTMSHLASAHIIDSEQNEEQYNNFLEIIKFFPDIKKSFANSSAIFLDSKYHFDLIRPGMALYGLNPLPHLKNPMLNTVSVFGRLLQIYQTDKEEHIGYSRTYKTKAGTKIAIVSVGYADGLFTHLSNRWSIYINNQEAPVIGRISMDLVTIDVSNINEQDLFIGQIAEIIGDNNTPEKLADIIGCNEYEIITHLGNRFKVTYVE